MLISSVTSEHTQESSLMFATFAREDSRSHRICGVIFETCIGLSFFSSYLRFYYSFQRRATIRLQFLWQTIRSANEPGSTYPNKAQRWSRRKRCDLQYISKYSDSVPIATRRLRKQCLDKPNAFDTELNSIWAFEITGHGQEAILPVSCQDRNRWCCDRIVKLFRRWKQRGRTWYWKITMNL